VPLGEFGAGVLDALPSPEAPHISRRVFLDEEGQPLDRTRISRRISAAMRRAGVNSTPEGVASLKSVRTTLGTVLAEAGRSLYLVGELLGHKQPSVTAVHYARVRTAELRPLVDAFDGWVRDGHLQDTFTEGAGSNARESC